MSNNGTSVESIQATLEPCLDISSASPYAALCCENCQIEEGCIKEVSRCKMGCDQCHACNDLVKVPFVNALALSRLKTGTHR